MAERLSKEMASRGITVVSGLATGIDTAAHRGAIQGGGRTIAVLGNGVDIAYPRENTDLMEAVTRHGCVLSQYPMGVGPSRGHFPYRNRIISGLCLGTLIVEAPLRSGALITARQAAEQGREVFAVPGPVGSEASAGPHRLIKEGAKLVECVEDILAELELPDQVKQGISLFPSSLDENYPNKPSQTGAKSTKAESPTRLMTSPATISSSHVPLATVSLSDIESRVMRVMKHDGLFVDEIAMAASLSISETLSSLTMLELKGMVQQFSGKRFAPR